MLYAGLGLSRQRLDVHVLDEEGQAVEVTAIRPDADALRTLASHVFRHGQQVTAVIESMTGAHFVHDQFELRGWDVAIGDAVKVKGLAPLAAKTDRIDAWVLAELARRDLVPEIWLPIPSVRAERERARFRLHLVRHRTALKNRIHATLMTFGHPVPVADLFGVSGRELLDWHRLPSPWSETLATSLQMVDELDARIRACTEELLALGADHPSVPLLMTVPGVGWVLANTIASEIGDIHRFASPKKLAGYTGLCPLVSQWAAAIAAGRSPRTGRSTCAGRSSRPPSTRPNTPTTRGATSGRSDRLGRQRGAKVGRVDLARDLAGAIWHVLTKNEPFSPAGPAISLVA